MASFAAAAAAGAGAPAAVFFSITEIADDMADSEEERHQEKYAEDECCHRESLPFKKNRITSFGVFQKQAF